MCVHVHDVSGLSHTELSPFAPHEPSGRETNPVGGKRSRYSPQVMSLSGEFDFANSRATFAKNCGPSYHQCPNSSASNGAVRIGGAPVVGYFWIASAQM